MTARLPCPPAPAPWRRTRPGSMTCSRRGRSGRGSGTVWLVWLAPRDRNKTLTCLAGAEPVVGAQHRQAQRLQWFVSESSWDHQKINSRRVELLARAPGTAPQPGGALVIDDSGDRKSGHATAGVSRQYLGSRGAIERGVVAVTTAWADERAYHPLHTRLYLPAPCLPEGRNDPSFQTKGQIAAGLVTDARTAGIPFRAVIADCFYGPSESPGLVLEDDPGPCGRSDFFARGHVSRGHVSRRHTPTAPSSRSTARRAGRWHDQPRRSSRSHRRAGQEPATQRLGPPCLHRGRAGGSTEAVDLSAGIAGDRW